MCGIVGVVSKSQSGFWKPQMDMFHELLYIDNFRGDDSTGVFMVNGSGDLEMLKEATSSPDFQRSKEYGDLMRKTFNQGKCLIGHNRKATKGSITDENAHPFVVDDRIILVHNGTLYGDYQKHVPEGEKVEVDSHAIAHLIHKHEDNVEAAVQELSGAYTLAWFDMKLQTLNFLRNSQRPMSWMETNDSWIFASEKNMLDWMVSRHTLKPLTGPVELKEGTLCTFTLDNGRWKVDSKEIKLTKPSSTPTHFNSYQDWCNPDDDMCGYGAFVTPHTATAQIDDARLPMRKDIMELRKAIEERGTKFNEVAAEHVAAANEGQSRRMMLSKGYAHRKEEEDFAFMTNAHITAETFSRIADDFSDGERYLAECFQYTYSNREDASQGYFLYALLNNSDNLMVRAFIPPEYDERILTEFCAQKRAISIKITGRAWRRFEDPQLWTTEGNGYGIFFGTDVKKVLTLSEATKETVNAQ